jgi:glutamate:GABA antiporter
MTTPNDTESASKFRRAEERVEKQSVVLRKELGLMDLVLTQILYIVGLSWVGVAAKLGPSHIVYWLAAIILFYAPSAAVVIYLNRLMPLEGGLYQWAKLGLGERAGFMTAWNLWIYVILLTSEIGLQAATNLSYALGPSAAWMPANKWFVTLASCVIIGSLVTVSMLGLSVGKWLHNAGAVIMLITFTALIALPILNLSRGTIKEYHPFAMALPTISLFSLNILGKLGFAALGGFEYVAILAGECRSPERAINRSVLIAAPVIAIMFILGTSSVMAFLSPDEINLIAPIPQVLSLGGRPFQIAGQILPVAILMILGIRVAQASVTFTANSRLPMVAGWDMLLPNWFTRLHSRYKTPVNSILLVGALTLLLGLGGLAGVGPQEAYQLLQSAAVIFYAISYLVMFALPIIGLKAVKPRPPIWLRVTSLSGFLMTLLNVVLSIFPIVKVESRVSFAAKIIAVVVIANIVGASIFALAERSRRSAPARAIAASAD